MIHARMKSIFVIALSLISFAASATDTIIYSTRPDGSRDYRVPARKVDGNLIYQLLTDGNRDYRIAAQRFENGEIYQIRTDGNRDYRVPSQRIEGR